MIDYPDHPVNIKQQLDRIHRVRRDLHRAMDARAEAEENVRMNIRMLEQSKRILLELGWKGTNC